MNLLTLKSVWDMPYKDDAEQFCDEHDELLIDGLCKVCYDIDRRNEDRDD